MTVSETVGQVVELEDKAEDAETEARAVTTVAVGEMLSLTDPLSEELGHGEGEKVARPVAIVAVGDTDCDAHVDTLPDALPELDTEPLDE